MSEEIHEQFFNRCMDNSSDIFEHLPTLARYARKVRHITEFGVRKGNSTTAFLAGLSVDGGVMHSYDIEAQQFWAPKIDGVEWNFHRDNTGAEDFRIEATQLLFIDSDHEYHHIVRELRNAPLVSRYIIMHDTAQDWIPRGGSGPHTAMNDFRSKNEGKWRLLEQRENCNGLTVFERIDQ